ncbi:amidohydrolase [Thermoplasmatales archaeon AK]|nr:amidohydrolase [Thermoplasmatales archaeon AK]
MKNLDVHSHILPDEAIKTLGGEIAPLPGSLFDIRVLGKSIAPMTKGFYDLDARRLELDKIGIDMQVLSPTHHLFFYDDLEKAKKSSRVQNEAISKVVKNSNGKYIGNATLPMQSTKDALNELEYAYSSLELNGIEIGTNVSGLNLDDESLFPIYERAQDLNLPIFVHPNDFMGGKRLQKYYMGIVVGTIAETTVAVTSMVFGGVFKRFPKLKMIFCHGGGAIPYQIGRLRHAAATRQEVRELGADLKSLMKTIYFDTVVFDDESLKLLVKERGDENVTLGTDYPFNMGQWDSASMISESRGIPESAKKKILFENAAKLYGLK